MLNLKNWRKKHKHQYNPPYKRKTSYFAVNYNIEPSVAFFTATDDHARVYAYQNVTGIIVNSGIETALSLRNWDVATL